MRPDLVIKLPLSLPIAYDNESPNGQRQRLWGACKGQQ